MKRAEPITCPGLFYATPALDGIISRIRIPGGVITSLQCRAIADLSEQLGDGDIQITNRANLQVRAIKEEISVDILHNLQAIALASAISEVDHLRNIMSSPTAGIDRQQLIDTRPLVKELDTYIASHLDLAELPPKFSLGFDGGETVSIANFHNEILFAAVKKNRDVYFRLYLSEKKDQLPVDAGILLPTEECISFAIALMKAYSNSLPLLRRNSDRSQKTRLRQILQQWGIDSFLEQITEYFPFPLRRQSLKLQPYLEHSQYRYQHLGIHLQQQEGLSYIGLVIPLGKLISEQIRKLANLAEVYGNGTLRLTPWQNLLIPDVPNARIDDLQTEIDRLGMYYSPNHPGSALVACTGNQGCASSATDTKNHALALAKYLEDRSILNQPINIHFTGCDKSCAQNRMGDITLLGTTIAKGNRTVEGYDVYVAKSDRDEKFGQLFDRNVPVENIPALIEQILTTNLKTISTPSTMPLEYIRDGDEIYRQSFAMIRSEANLSVLPDDLAAIAVRLIHSCGMTDIVSDLEASSNAVTIGRKALAAGATILCDSQMVANGITRSRLPADNLIVCTLKDSQVPEIARQIGNTRSAAALELWRSHLQDAVVAIGNAPTALFYLLEMLDAGAPKPALILGFPVGFVGALESKATLAEDSRGVPFITLHGRRGGSAIAVAAVNALATEREIY